MSAYSDLVASHGAVHYWRLDETAGTSAIDSIGGSTGTLTGAVALNQPGAITDGTAGMGFTGDPTVVTIGGRISSTVFPTITQPLTVELWVKTNVPEERAMASTRNGPSNGALFMGILTGKLRTYYDPVGSYSSGVRSIADGLWHHVVWVFVGGSPITPYVDGTVEALTPAQTTSALCSWDRLTLGFEPVGGAKAWTGSLDEVAIYPRALTPAEITQHYTVGTTVQASVPSAGCDHTTVWSQHLATLTAPKVESERAYLANLYGQPPGQDLSTLVSRWLQAINCGGGTTEVASPETVQTAVARTAAADTLTLSFPGATGNGRGVVVGVISSSSSALPAGACSDNKGNSYTRVLSQTGTANSLAVYLCPKGTGGPVHTITIAPGLGATDLMATALEIRGVGNGLAVDASGSTAGSSATPAATSSAVTTAGLISLALMALDTQQTTLTVATSDGQSPDWTQEAEALGA